VFVWSPILTALSFVCLCFQRYQNRYFMLAGLSTLLAWSFYGGVNRRFDLMEDGLKTATTIRYALEWDELLEMEYHNEAYKDNEESILHLLLAFEYAHEAHLLQENVTKKQKDMFRLEKDAEGKKEKADAEEKEASLWAMRAFGDGRASVGSALTGVELAKRAQDENELGKKVLQQANMTLTEGTDKLHRAQETLQLAEEALNHTTLDKGLCRWMPLVCDGIRKQVAPNSTYFGSPSDLVIRANNDIQDALQQIHDAKVEKDWAIELLVNASVHANLSTEILLDAKMFRKQAKTDQQQVNKYQTEELEYEREYNADQKFIDKDSTDIFIDEKRMYNYTNTSRDFLDMAISDHNGFRQAVERYQLSRQRAVDMETLLVVKTNESKHHVAKAGWSALAACIAGTCLLALVAVQIVAAFRYQRPFQWIVRAPPDTTHDLLYLLNHLFIFLLTMGYVGELLINFGRERKIVRATIVVVFSILGASLQVTLLHFLPHICKLHKSSNLDWRVTQVLLREDIVKKGSIVSLVFACEVLFSWVNIGAMAFERAYKLNNWWCWITVVFLASCYAIFVLKNEILPRQVDTSPYLDVFDEPLSVRSNPLSSNMTTAAAFNLEEEKHSLLAQPFPEASASPSIRASMSEVAQASVPGSVTHSTAAAADIFNPVSKSSSSSTSSMRSVPFGSAEAYGYGAMGNGDNSHLSILPEIRASFLVSWTAELRKIRLLIEILLASWAIWIIRRDVALIVKLSSLAQGVAWGGCPLWILNVFLLTALAIFAMSYKKKA
jgi:hypothetical protein